MPDFYVVATPIGNLEDITLRALRVLKEVDVVLCEDTRQTRKLLDHYDIKTRAVSYHQHSGDSKIGYIIEKLREGKNMALVSDAGTPCISDPGARLIASIMEELGDSIGIIPVPGPSAAISAASISGFKVDRFVFMGFLPHKKGRQTMMRKIAGSEYPVIFYESPHRIMKALAQLGEVLEEGRRAVVVREMTKKFETAYRGTVGEIAKKLENDKIKGEFVVVVDKK